ncbi:phosphatidylinositol phosphate phosphatase [Hysterangium stoloniferum]|nr:phosphatidylinositol phosphate phosphatase [Hysterangium stoloniferum]
MLTLLHVVSYGAAAAAFAFVTLSLASGLLWLAEIIEEHSRVAKIVGKRTIYCVITFHILLYVVDRDLPLSHILFSIACHLVYLLNFRTFPIISLTSWSFVASVLMVVADHFIWFFHFSHVVEETRKRERRWRHPKDPGVHAPTFFDIATFFGICVWLVPLFLFLSLTANENALPTIQGTSSSSSGLETEKKQRQSLFVSLSSRFTSVIPGRIRPGHLRKDSDGIIAPRSISRPPSPLPPDSSLLSPVFQAPPPSPGAPPHERNGLPRRALVFRTTAEGSRSGQAVVEFIPKDEVALSGVVRLSSRPVKGCLDIFLAVIISSTEIGNLCPSSKTPEKVSRINDIAFFSLTSSTYDDLSVASEGLASPDFQADQIMREPYASQNAPNVYEHPCAPLTKILSSGSFYHAAYPHWDISTRLSERIKRGHGAERDVAAFDERFVWNEYVVRGLLDFRDRLDPQERQELDHCQFITLAIQGYVGVFTIPLPASPQSGSPTVATLAMISRLGWRRAGTRFNTRGVDDDGNCANFVETEVIFNTDTFCLSYVQVRGSVPLFWEQQGFQTFGQKIQITRPQVASQPAFDRHFGQLVEQYSAVHAINLLGIKENEAILTTAYCQHLKAGKAAGGEAIGFTNFDFHTIVRNLGHDSVTKELLRIGGLYQDLDRFGWTICDLATGDIVTHQTGVFRTNCLDCLDRTNFVQDILSKSILERYIRNICVEWTASISLWSAHREVWAENGDALSRIYAGTGALNTSFTRTGKRTLAGVLSDATKSVSRAYINNFQDKAKQAAIDMFLGNMSLQKPVTVFDPIHDSVRAALVQRVSEYSSTELSTLFVGTWNLNGRPPSESILPWLFPTHRPDLFVLGFQEIVPLTAQQIIQTDPEKKKMWENVIIDTLAHRPTKTSEYVILRSEQLVGTALILLVKSKLVGQIRNVEGATKKTGLRGMSGNKGAVGIRLDYHDTSFCFLTAHLAAGHANIEERNSDYRTIVNGLHFLKGKTIGSHENIIWLADTNYRIDMDNEIVRSLAKAGDYDGLVAMDQLKQAMDSQAVFVGFEEGPLLFPPTYRYDVGTDDYDTSEKMRIPAWTDRVLYRGTQMDLTKYSRAELRGSDHRPVFAIFRATIRIVDHTKRAALNHQLLQSVVTAVPGETLDKKLAKLTFIEDVIDDDPTVPPPSTDRHAWWDGPGHPNGRFHVLIEKTRQNPFDTSDESSVGSSPSSSDEELYSHAQKLQTPMIPAQRTPLPPPPRLKLAINIVPSKDKDIG